MYRILVLVDVGDVKRLGRDVKGLRDGIYEFGVGAELREGYLLREVGNVNHVRVISIYYNLAEAADGLLSKIKCQIPTAADLWLAAQQLDHARTPIHYESIL